METKEMTALNSSAPTDERQSSQIRDYSINDLSDNCKPFDVSELSDKPIVFEVFTDSEDENNALKLLNKIEKSKEYQRKEKIMNIIGEDNAHAIKNILNKIKK